MNVNLHLEALPLSSYGFPVAVPVIKTSVPPRFAAFFIWPCPHSPITRVSMHSIHLSLSCFVTTGACFQVARGAQKVLKVSPISVTQVTQVTQPKLAGAQ